jgi:AcrR family transcriptional regulator
MTERGDTTRARLIAAATAVAAEQGYAHATTRAIAEAAGVSEGTIYRHFPDKKALFLAAVVDGNSEVLGELDALPGRAGTGTVIGNLTEALKTLAGLRAEVMPLELAMLADPEMGARRGVAPSSGDAPGPAGAIAAYLAAEQRVGRVRADVDCYVAEVALLTVLFGLALSPSPDGEPVDSALLAATVGMFVTGVAVAG